MCLDKHNGIAYASKQRLKDANKIQLELLGKNKLHIHKIITENFLPIYAKSCHISAAKESEGDRQVTEMLAKLRASFTHQGHSGILP